MTPVERQLSRNNGHTPARKRVVIAYIEAHDDGDEEEDGAHERSVLRGLSRAGHGLWSQDVPWCVPALILHPRTHVSRESYSW